VQFLIQISLGYFNFMAEFLKKKETMSHDISPKEPEGLEDFTIL
jgi:hypothetical protein